MGHAMDGHWQIKLLESLQAQSGERIITRFQTHKTAALLAYLAYYPHRSHPRDPLTEFLWPESPPQAARASLSMALSSLRHQLEPPGMPAGAVIVANRSSVRLNPDAVHT